MTSPGRIDGIEPHEFNEDVDDASMCMCGIPALVHWRYEPREHTHTLAVDLNGLTYCVECWRGERLWFEPNDHAILTFLDDETGETAEIHALCIRPSGAGPGWVLTDGTRLPLRPRPVIKCDIVYPDAHKGTEIVIHPIPEPASDTTEHTTQETDQHDRNPDPGP